MKIKKIEALPVRIPLKSPLKLASFTVRFMHYVVVKIHTDEGIVGYGEATPSWDVNGETLGSVVAFIRLLQDRDMLGYSLIGESLATLGDVEYLMTKIIDPPDRFALVAGNSSAKAGLEQAMFDVVTRATGEPLYGLLGSEARTVTFSSTIGILNPADTLTQIRLAVESGSTIIRLKIGCPDVFGLQGFERDISAVRSGRDLLEKISPAVRLVADANQGLLNVENALHFCREVEGCLDWLEQPVLANDVSGFAALKNKTTVPLMADESLTSSKDAERFFTTGGVDYFNVKLMKTGGIFGALRLIDCAAKKGISCYIGSMIESAFGILPGLVVNMLRSETIGTDLNVFEQLADQYSLPPAISRNSIAINSAYFQQMINDDFLHLNRIDL